MRPSRANDEKRQATEGIFFMRNRVHQEGPCIGPPPEGCHPRSLGSGVLSPAQGWDFVRLFWHQNCYRTMQLCAESSDISAPNQSSPLFLKGFAAWNTAAMTQPESPSAAFVALNCAGHRASSASSKRCCTSVL